MPKLNWKDIDESTDGNYERIEPNGYVCVITAMENVPEKQYVRLGYDIAEGEHQGFYSDDYYADKPWSHSVAMSYKETACGMLKARLTRIQESNAGFDPFAAFDADNWQAFIGKQFGGLIGEEEYQANDGSIKTSLKLRTFKSVADIKSGNFEIPKIKKLKGASNATQTQAQPYSDDDVPFL